jgi:hypothetical protein
LSGTPNFFFSSLAAFCCVVVAAAAGEEVGSNVAAFFLRGPLHCVKSLISMTSLFLLQINLPPLHEGCDTVVWVHQLLLMENPTHFQAMLSTHQWAHHDVDIMIDHY